MRTWYFSNPYSGVGDKSLTLSFGRDEVMFDIANIAHAEGDVLPAEALHTKHQVQEALEDGNREIVTRAVATAFAVVCRAFEPLSDGASADGQTLRNEYQEPAAYRLTALVPKTFSKASAQLAQTLAHDYLVACGLFALFLVVYPDGAAKWRAMADGALDQLRAVAKSASGSCLNRPCKPF